MTDNLAGQLWFGAECLAAGSSIMNKESESEAMRPLAKAVTKSLEKVRSLLREQVLSANHNYTEVIRENLKIFDRLFADFEYNYVSCMVHVKTKKVNSYSKIGNCANFNFQFSHATSGVRFAPRFDRIIFRYFGSRNKTRVYYPRTRGQLRSQFDVCHSQIGNSLRPFGLSPRPFECGKESQRFSIAFSAI